MTSIVKQNNVRQTGKRSESLKKMSDNRMNFQRNKKKSRKYNCGKSKKGRQLRLPFKKCSNDME